MPSGKHVFVSQKGVQYVIDKYLDGGDLDELRKLNTEYSKEEFREELVNRIEKNSGDAGWIPKSYGDELVANAGAIIGTTREETYTKNNKRVTTYTARSGKKYYEEDKGRLRSYETGKFASKQSFKK